MMTLEQIKAAVDAGKKVCHMSTAYIVRKWSNGYHIFCTFNDYAIGLTHQDGVTMNGKPEDFYIFKTATDLFIERFELVEQLGIIRAVRLDPFAAKAEYAILDKLEAFGGAIRIDGVERFELDAFTVQVFALRMEADDMGMDRGSDQIAKSDFEVVAAGDIFRSANEQSRYAEEQRTHAGRAMARGIAAAKVAAPVLTLEAAIDHAVDLSDDGSNAEYVRGMSELLACMFPDNGECAYERAQEISAIIVKKINDASRP